MSPPERRRESDLARIEAALSSGQATAPEPRERELQEIALLVRAESAAPDAAFVREMDRRVSRGFRRPSRFDLALPDALRRFWVPALTAAACTLAVLAVALGVFGGDDGGGRGRPVARAPAAPAPADGVAREARLAL